jgi:uncharacterized protein
MHRDIAARVDALEWPALAESLASYGYAKTAALLTAEECRELVASYDDDTRFRSHIDMARFRFGEGDYKYFTYPLPAIVEQLRRAFYPHLAPIANQWWSDLGERNRFADTLDGLLERCHTKGQCRPTPLLLQYHAGGYNCLHQDLYGDVYFPLQVAVFLSAPDIDYSGGEFLLVEQRPRAQSAGEAIRPNQGEAVIFTTRVRPVKGTRGFYRVNVRHGVSRVREGRRYTLGIIFHDAK